MLICHGRITKRIRSIDKGAPRVIPFLLSALHKGESRKILSRDTMEEGEEGGRERKEGRGGGWIRGE